MRKDPTEGDRATVRSRLRYVLRETSRSPGWVEAESRRLALGRGWKPFSSGEVWRMAEGDRGKRPGTDKLGVIAELLGCSFNFLALGNGAPFTSSDPPMARLQQEVADLRTTIEQLISRPVPPAKASHATPPHGVARIRPSGGQIRPKR